MQISRDYLIRQALARHGYLILPGVLNDRRGKQITIVPLVVSKSVTTTRRI